jgi:hypothetical protein
MREKRRLTVFENRVLRRIFGPNRGEVPEEWRKLRNEKLNDLYSTNIVRVIKSRRMRWADMWNVWGIVAHRDLVGNIERKRQLGRPRHR